MKRSLKRSVKRSWTLTALVVLVGFAALAFIHAPALQSSVNQHPLVALEQATRSYAYSESWAQLSEQNDKYWQVQQLAWTIRVVLGATVQIVPRAMIPVNGDIAGVTLIQERSIFVNNKIHTNAQLSTLAHEAGHLLQPGTLAYPQGEVFAEGVAYLVSKHFGEDNLHSHARYLAQYKTGLSVLDVYRAEIEYAARILQGK